MVEVAAYHEEVWVAAFAGALLLPSNNPVVHPGLRGATVAPFRPAKARGRELFILARLYP